MPPQSESDYYPYGGEISISGGDSNHYKFTGKERDAESGLDNFGARYNASSLGRFMTPDWGPGPVPYANMGSPQTLNLYAYVMNNPVSKTDPTGHACEQTDCDDSHGQGSSLAQDFVGSLQQAWRGSSVAEDFQNAAAAALAAQGELLTASEESPAEQTTASNPSAQVHHAAQNRQPDGSYKATPAQLEEIKAADKNGTTIKTKNDTKGECVTACEHFTGVPGPTSSWKGGKPASELTDKDKGTAIATFIKGSDGEWHYLPDAGGHKNSGVFMGTSTKGTFWMADQWPQGKPVSIWNVGSNPDNASMNAASYRVIIVPNP